MSAHPGTGPASKQEARIVIDHVRGSRRGKRQEFPLGARVRFGRHPANEVAFHARRDLDASSRHAELVPGTDAAGVSGADYVLRDTGSSNGTLVAGRVHAEIPIPRDTPITVAFGASGPVARIFIGVKPPAPVPRSALRSLWERVQSAPGAWPIWVALALGLATLVAWVSLV
jgi:hypothetical protein